MGVDLGDIVPATTIQMEELSGRRVAVDAHNILYQFLSIIRGRDGSPLQDSQGRVTSHLSGLLYRTGNLVEAGIEPAFVFDGVPPEVKREELKRRKERKEQAREAMEEALEEGDLETARTKAAQQATLTGEMVERAQALLDALGLPHVTAPSEGEAQAAHLAARGDVWACVGQDYDTLLCGTPRLVRNLTVTGRRKLPGRDEYVTVEPERIDLDAVLDETGLTREQLVDVALLCGTDFNDGVKGIGPKTGLETIREHGSIEAADVDADWEVDLDDLRQLFLDPDVDEDVTLEWRPVDDEAVVELLVGEHDFSEDRVEKALEKYHAFEDEKKQGRLDEWS